MKKQDAITLLGGSVTAAAQAIGVSPSAISQWPIDLTPRLIDRVQAALARRGRGVVSDLASKTKVSDEAAHV